MKQYSFMSESLNKILKRSLKLNSKNSKRYIDSWIHNRMNGQSMDDSKLDYAKRMFVGNRERLKNTASKNKRSLVFDNSSDPNLSAIAVNGDFRSMLDNSKTSSDFIGTAIRNGNDIAELSFPTKRNDIKSILNSYLVNSHEADEYSKVLRLAKKYKLTPSQVLILIKKQYNTGHAPGVIKKELKRNSDLKRMFDVDLLKNNPRSEKEIQVDKIRFRPEKIKKTLSRQELTDFNNNGMFQDPKDLAKFIEDARSYGIIK